MTNLLQQAIDCNEGDRAVKIIQDALGIESDDVANYCFPQTWPADRERRARIIGEWLRSAAWTATRNHSGSSGEGWPTLSVSKDPPPHARLSGCRTF